MTSLIVKVGVTSLRILSIYAKETIFPVHWSALTESNLIIQPYPVICIQLNIDKMCISKPGSKPVYREGLESGVNVQLELGSLSRNMQLLLVIQGYPQKIRPTLRPVIPQSKKTTFRKNDTQ